MKRRNTIVFLTAIICILFTVLLILRNTATAEEGFQTEGTVPKKIWTYWDSKDTVPDILNTCVDSWRKYNPDYEIILVYKDTVGDYVDIPDTLKTHPNFTDTRSRYADLVRLFLLEKYGGIWMDMSCIMYQPLDDWLPKTDFFCFTYDQGRKNHPFPILENWFIAVKPQHPFIQAWKKEFLEIQSFPSVKEYVASRRKMGVDISTIEHMADYLAMHVGAQKILQIDKYDSQTLTMRETSQPGGPFWFLIKNGWNADKGIEEACENPDLRKPFLKFHGPSRDVFLKRFKTDMTNEKCHWF